VTRARVVTLLSMGTQVVLRNAILGRRKWNTGSVGPSPILGQLLSTASCNVIWGQADTIYTHPAMDCLPGLTHSSKSHLR
jgi:hypothetical protein